MMSCFWYKNPPLHKRMINSEIINNTANDLTKT